jgi:hypothetical protein
MTFRDSASNAAQLRSADDSGGYRHALTDQSGIIGEIFFTNSSEAARSPILSPATA